LSFFVILSFNFVIIYFLFFDLSFFISLRKIYGQTVPSQVAGTQVALVAIVFLAPL